MLKKITAPISKILHKLFALADKPRQLVFRLPLLHRLPIKLQRWIYFVLSPLCLCILFFAYILWGLPLPSQLTSESRNPVSTQILDRNGKLIYEIYESKRRTPITLDDVPKYVPQATVAIEDKDFYQHHGIDPRGVARALFKTSTAQGLQGGSTITQQLVKTTLLSNERTIKRKIQELVLTLIIEAWYPKDKILEMYLNNVPYGGTAWGIESASETYFGKPAKDLTIAEAALLAGLPQRPTAYSPFGAHPELAQDRQKVVLKDMLDQHYITEEQAKQAAEEELKFVQKDTNLKAPHFVLYVKEQLVDKYGEDAVEHGGLRVRTTLDLDVQEFAQKEIFDEVSKLKRENVGNGAAIVTNPQTGEIYAMVGSKDYFAQDEDGKVNVVLAKRQPGSSIKPLNYAMALRDGKITPATALADIPTCFAGGGQEAYCPLNYDNSFHGPIQTRFALANSLNIPAVRVLALNGLADFIDFATKMGITTFSDPRNYGLSLTLGGGEVRMIDMAQAFGVFANAGVKQQPISILEVKDWKGNVLQEAQIPQGIQVLPQDVAYLISHILYDSNARSMVFGTSSYLNVGGHPEVSVKTGTTNDKRDNWTIGYNPEVVVATWVGNNDNQPMSRVASGVTGASPIWNRIIKFTLDRIESGNLAGTNQTPQKHTHVWAEKPSTVVGTNVCTTTGTLPPNAADATTEVDPNNAGCPVRYEYFIEDHLPQPYNALPMPLRLYNDSQAMAPDDAPDDQIHMEDHQTITDPLGTLICLDCPGGQKNKVTINPASIPGIIERPENYNYKDQLTPYGGQ